MTNPLEQIVRPFADDPSIRPTPIALPGQSVPLPVLLQIGRKGGNKTCSMSFSYSSSTYMVQQLGVGETGYHQNKVYQVDASGARTGNYIKHNVIEYAAYRGINGDGWIVTAAGAKDNGGPNTEVGSTQKQQQQSFPLSPQAPIPPIGGPFGPP